MRKPCGIGLYLLLGCYLPIAAAVELEELRSAGDMALAQMDYVTAKYYFDRIRESEDWPLYPNRMDVLNKLGMIHENQSQYREAVEYYREVLAILAEQESSTGDSTFAFYELRYADCLERAGFYARAGDLYRQMLETSNSNMHVAVLQRLIHNYGFHTPSEEQMQTLHDRVVRDNLETLGWELADLYRIREASTKSYELYEQLWPKNPNMALHYVAPMAEVYISVKRLDELVDAIHALLDSSASGIPFLLLEMQLLEHANRGEDALHLLETYLTELGKRDGITNFGDLVGTDTNDLLVKWVDLANRYGDVELVERQIRRITQRIPMDMRWHEKLANVLLREGKSVEALQVWKDWAQKNRANPLAVINAARQMMNLDSSETAMDVMAEIEGRIPPALAIQEGEIALRLGRINQALSAYTLATTSGAVHPDQIVNSIAAYAERASDVSPLVASLLQAATETPFRDTPSWLRDALIQITIRFGHQAELEALTTGDESDVWKIHMAREALNQGKRKWTRHLLESISAESLYKPTADLELASLIGEETDVPSQRRAAELLKPAIVDLLEATGPVRLTSTAVDRLLQYGNYCLNGYQPGEALSAVRCIESSSITLSHPLDSSTVDRLSLARGRALVQFGSFQPGLDAIDTVKTNDVAGDAFFLKANVLLALNRIEDARALLTEIAESRQYNKNSNDALALLCAMEPLVGDSLELFCLSQLYQLQGRKDDALPALRQLAVERYGEETEEWARFAIGKIEAENGNWQSAREEWERLLLDVDHPLIHGITRLNLTRLPQPSGEIIADMTAYQKIMLDFPDTLIFDLAKMEAQQVSARRIQ
jgi:tetratricopeptide (TPR) repeat protein